MEKQTKQESSPEKKKLRSNKLFDATDIEGGKNKLVFEVAEKVNKELSKFPEFIGVFPFGSQTKGYSNAESDIDAYVLYEKWTDEIDDVLRATENEYKEKNIAVHFIETTYGKKEIEKIWDDNRSLLAGSSVIFRPGKGPKIEQYRTALKTELNQLPDKKKNARIEEIIALLMYNDEASLPKMKERMAEFDKEEWLKQRREMWEKKVKGSVF